MTSPLFALTVGPELDWTGAAPHWPVQCRHCDSLDVAQQQLADSSPDALVVSCAKGSEAEALTNWTALSQATLASAVVVVVPSPTVDLARRLLQAGIQDVVPAEQATPDLLGRSVWLSAQRHQAEQALRRAWSIDMTTGLPNQAQLVELLSQMCSLREREPARMALIALRIEGLNSAFTAWGPQAALTLRRKMAVRLRSGVRASDVVCSLGNDAFAVLLPRTESGDVTEQVERKLVRLLSQPYPFNGQAVQMSVATGISHYPEDGRTADELLRRSLSMSVNQRGEGRTDIGGHVDRSTAPAANDE